MIGEELPFFGDVFFGRGGGIDVEMVAPAGEFEAILAEVARLLAEVFQLEIGPLAGEERDGSGHVINGVFAG